MFYSPLRYPGGKSKLTPYILETLKLNNLEGGTYVEPFAGGAAIAWYLLLRGHVDKVYINDLNLSIYAFWYSVLNQTEQLCELIKTTPVTIDEWYKQKEFQDSAKSTLIERGFSTFFLNRTNRSGIIKGGVIGGFSQEGTYKLDCRFNKEVLINIIHDISNRKDSINLSNLDAVDFITEVMPTLDDKCLINIDPPYYVKGKGLYQNFFKHDDHYRLYECVRTIKQPWIVTYDDAPEINDIYSEFSPHPFGLTYTAQIKRKGTEVIIHSSVVEVCKYKPDITFRELSKIKKQLVK
ncbi:MAG: DNA adenine methylase [Methylobacter sp.]|nr:DNA adenine methylase [Methylobacter sp.]